jgi:hypothetical protein
MVRSETGAQQLPEISLRSQGGTGNDLFDRRTGIAFAPRVTFSFPKDTG